MSAATVIAIQASQRAREAKIVSCQGIEQSFNSTTATVVQQQRYAECVQLLHPVTYSATSVLIMKIAIAMIFIGCIVGTIIGWRDSRWSLVIPGFLCGGAVVIIGELILWLVGMGVLFLFN